jgi:P pilus assembly chaperone PapD
MNFVRTLAAAAALPLTALVATSEARAELILSQLVVDLQPGKLARHDIEVINNGPETLYVAVEPREVVGAGTSQSSSRQDPDPEKLGLLVSPARMVLDPGKRKLLRVAAIAGSSNHERVYRVTVKPVVGQLSSESGGLKILVGYDVLVLVRPSAAHVQINGTRSDKTLTLRNDGNASIELTGGKQCNTRGKDCHDLPGGRLYVGAEKNVPIDPARPASYMLKMRDEFIPKQF